MLAALVEVSADPTNQKAIDNVNSYALGFFIMGIIAGVVTTIDLGCFGIVGDLITRKIRI